MVHVDSPFVNLVGIEMIQMADGTCIARLPRRDDLTNGNGLVHGGAITTLIDTAFARAIESVLEPGEWCATIEMKVNFLAAGSGDLTARAAILTRSRRLAAVEASVTDEAGLRLVAKALGTFAIRHR